MAIEKIKRKEGSVYRVRIYQNGSRVVSRVFKRHYDAVQFEKEARISSGFLSNERLTFEEAAQKWLTGHAEICMAPSSLVQEKTTLAAHIFPRIGKVQLSQIGPDHLEGLIADLKKKGLAVRTIHRILSPVSSILNYFIKRRVLQYNPMSALDKRRLFRTEQEDFDFWSLEEVRIFLQFAFQKYAGTDFEGIYLFYKVALNTGLRLGELRALKWRDIDFKSRLITVRESYCDRARSTKKPKSGHIRHVPMSEAIWSDLEMTHQQKKSELVFHWNGNIIHGSNFRNRFFLRDISESGVRRIRIHDLRHTFASHFVMNGGNVYELQAILGHSDIKMTQRYAHLSKAYIATRTYVSLDGGKVIKANFGSTNSPTNHPQNDFTQKMRNVSC